MPGRANPSSADALIKVLIVVLLLALIASLGSGFYFLMVDQGDKNKRRTFHSLGVRVSLASALMLVIIYGFSTGKLKSQAPWDQPAWQAKPPQQSEPAAE